MAAAVAVVVGFVVGLGLNEDAVVSTAVVKDGVRLLGGMLVIDIVATVETVVAVTSSKYESLVMEYAK